MKEAEIMVWNKIGFIMTVFAIIFLTCLEILPITAIVFAETKEICLMDKGGIKVSYSTETSNKENVFRIKFDHRASTENTQQRLKIKLLSETGRVIDYSPINEMEKEEDWLIEKGFTSSAKKEIPIVLPKEETKLQMFIEMDERVKHPTNQDERKVNKNILDQTESYWLEVATNSNQYSPNKETEKSTNASISMEKTKLLQAGPEIPATAQASLTGQNDLYKNKLPKYLFGSSIGDYPEHSWIPNNQLNVINHQGGYEKQAADVWDGVDHWDVAADDHTKSYIHYGQMTKPNLSIRKLVKETNVENEFDVQMNIRGYLNYDPGVDLVFLLDNSYSMRELKRKPDASSAFTSLINQLESMYVANTDNIRIGGNIFAAYQPEIGWNDSQTVVDISNSPAKWKSLDTNYRNLEPDGNTHTERALATARDLFQKADATSKRKKILFLLTDGGPTHSWTPKEAVADNSMYFDPIRITKVNDKVGNQYRVGTTLGNGNLPLEMTTKIRVPYNPQNPPIPPNSLRITSHLTPANSMAQSLKESDIEIHSLALEISAKGSNPNEKHSDAELLRGLYKMASKKRDAAGDTQNDYFFYEAKRSSEIADYLKQWYNTIVRTVDQGEITDDLGDMVELVGNPENPKQIKHGQEKDITATDMPKIATANNKRTINVSNLNLSDGQEVQLTYRVRLKTDDTNFKSGTWYQVNKSSTFSPTPERTTDKLDFGIPSVKAPIKFEDFDIPVEVQWENDNADHWKMREDVTAVLQKKEGANWTDQKQLTLKNDASTKGKFMDVPGDPAINYRVIQRVGNSDKVIGYAKPAYTPNNFHSNDLPTEGVIIKNRLMTTDTSFKKVGHDGSTPFTGNDKPKFTATLTEKNIVAEKDVAPTDDGTVTFKDLPIGIFNVEETTVPTGYIKIKDFAITVSEKDDGSGVEATIDGKNTDVTKTNKLKPFELVVHKTDNTDTALKGAAFRLTGVENTYNKTLENGPAFTFTGLEPGTYELAETKTPNGVIGLDKKIQIRITPQGTVVIESHPQVEGIGGITASGNKLEVTVKNEPHVGTLPSTGSLAGKKILFISALCLVLGVSLTIGYLYWNRQKAH